ncbi:MAG: hypothetical protein AAB922_01270 [Patescibacteria group bacterium]
MSKLEIGSGRKPHNGYETIDIEAYAKPTYLGDFRTMIFSDIDEIRAHHILEHFSREEGEKVLKLWHSWLKLDGVLIVETPDFEGICENFNKDKYWMTRHAYGSQEAEWAFHRDGWYEEKFLFLLPKLGYEILEMRRNVSRKILPNITVIAKKI